MSAKTKQAQDSQLLQVGKEVRDLRKAKGLTLTALANMTGITAGYISHIERGRAKPSLKSLQKISEALGVATGWFLRDGGQTNSPPYVTRANEHRRLTYTALWTDDYLNEENYLITPRLDQKVAMGISILQPNASSGDDEYSLDSDVACYVLKGQLTLVVGDETYVLGEGDSYFLPEGTVHCYRNSGDDILKWLWSIAPPRF